MHEMYRYDQCVPKREICSAVRVKDDNFDEIRDLVQMKMTVNTNRNGHIDTIIISDTLEVKNGDYIIKDSTLKITKLSSDEFKKRYRFLTHE